MMNFKEAHEFFVIDGKLIKSALYDWTQHYRSYIKYKEKNHKYGTKIMKKYCNNLESMFRGEK